MSISKQRFDFHSYQYNNDVESNSLFVSINHPINPIFKRDFYIISENSNKEYSFQVSQSQENKTLRCTIPFSSLQSSHISIWYKALPRHKVIATLNIKELLANQNHFTRKVDFLISKHRVTVSVTLSVHPPLPSITENAIPFEYYLIDSIQRRYLQKYVFLSHSFI